MDNHEGQRFQARIYVNKRLVDEVEMVKLLYEDFRRILADQGYKPKGEIKVKECDLPPNSHGLFPMDVSSQVEKAV